MTVFSDITARAADKHGGHQALQQSLPEILSDSALRAIADDRWLAGMAKVIMRSGFSWKVVENKWPGFEVAFNSFDPHSIAMFSDDDLARLVSDASIIRNGQKIRAIQDNAIMVTRMIKDHGSAGAFFAGWPPDDFVGLWDFLKREGSRLGGKTSAYFLREIGWDTPIMSKDVVRALMREGVIEKDPTSKKALTQVQIAFNDWHDESGVAYTHISRILALSVG